MSKKRIIKKYDQLTPELRRLVVEQYPDGFEDEMITFQTPKGEIELAISVETEDTAYLIKMPKDSIPDIDDISSKLNTDEIDSISGIEVEENISDL